MSGPQIQQRQAKHVPRILCTVHATTHVYDVIVWIWQVVWLCYIVVSIKQCNSCALNGSYDLYRGWFVAFNVSLLLMCAIKM